MKFSWKSHLRRRVIKTKFCKHIKSVKLVSDVPQYPHGRKEWYLYGDERGGIILPMNDKFCKKCGKPIAPLKKVKGEWMRYKVTVKFIRLNVKGKVEKNERVSVVEAKDAKVAREEYMNRFWANEPNCQEIRSIKVEKVKDEN